VSPSCINEPGGVVSAARRFIRTVRPVNQRGQMPGQMFAVVLQDDQRVGIIGYWERTWRTRQAGVSCQPSMGAALPPPLPGPSPGARMPSSGMSTCTRVFPTWAYAAWPARMPLVVLRSLPVVRCFMWPE
jgi:hypothetical protein